MDRNYCFPELKKLETDRLRENVHKEGTSTSKELHVVYTVHVHTCIYIDTETVNRTYIICTCTYTMRYLLHINVHNSVLCIRKPHNKNFHHIQCTAHIT